MTTKTYSYTDNHYDYSASRATWNVTYAFSDVTVSGSTFSIPNLSVTIKCTSNWELAGLKGEIHLNDIRIGGKTTSKEKTVYFGPWQPSLNSKTYSKTVTLTGAISCNTSTFFTSSNKTVKKLLVKSYDTDLHFYDATLSSINISKNHYILSNSTYEMGYVTLNAPPTYAVGTMTKDTVNYYKGLTTVSVPVDASSGSYGAKYGGDITSIKLTIGSQTKTVTPNSPKYSGNLSIKLSTAGTFTPSVTVTDSRGQVTTKTLSKITVVQPSAPTFQVGALYKTQSSPENGYWTKLTTACVDVSNIQTYAGGYVKSIALYFERAGTTGSTDLYGTKLDFTQSSQPSSPQTISCLLTRSGNFTPLVRLIDSANQTKDIRLNSISVNQYTLPGISDLKLERALNGPNLLPPIPPGILDPEGKYCLIESTFTYQNDMAELLEPIVKVRDKDAQEISSVTTWYTNWDETSGLSSPVNWTNYNPSSPVTLYALTSISNGIFEHAESYEIFIQAKDSNNFSSDIITQTLPTAFFTLDFLAGGKEVAFGQSAHIDHLYQSLLDLNLSSAPTFEQDTYYDRVVDNSGIISYVKLESAPSDWSANWESYFWLKYGKGLFKCNMDMEVDSVEVGANLEVFGETKLGGELYVAGNIYPEDEIHLTNRGYYTHTTAANMSQGNPSENVWRAMITARDDGGKNFATVTSVIRTTGQVQTYLQAQRDVNGTNTQNNFTIGVNADGSASYSVTSPLQFRSAIGIRHGQTAGITVLAGMYNDASISFGKTYSSAPTVIVGFASSSIEGGFGKCSCAVHSVTTTGCKVRVFNGDTAQRTPNVTWVAIG